MSSASDIPKRLCVTGIAYVTSDVNFKCYFQQFGDMEHAEIVRDRQGRSKGYGFISYLNPESVAKVLQIMHVLDGRKIEIGLDNRSTNNRRIFVARIPPEITENDFRNYFQLFGQVQDAYMPKDHTRQSYRGIGFVTFDNPETVDHVVRYKHELGGAFIAVDRAIMQNENVAVPAQNFASPDNQMALDLSRLNVTNSGLQQDPRSTLIGPPSIPLSPPSTLYSPKDVVPDATNFNTYPYLNNVVDVQNQLQYINNQQHFMNQIPNSPVDNFSFNNLMEAIQQPQFLSNRSEILSPVAMEAIQQQQILSSRSDIFSPVASPVLGQGQVQVQQQQPGAELGGYRIFITKLTRDTNEQDIREYFQKYGFILDVYLPKNVQNRREHRGFGFVTFETQTSVQRLVSDGDHRIKGATIVIDVALPRRDQLNIDVSAQNQVPEFVFGPTM